MDLARTIRQLRAVVEKEARQTVRDRRMMFLLLGSPIIQLVIFGYAVNLDVDRVPTVIVDHDRTPASRLHAQRLVADGTLLRVADVRDDALAERYLEQGRAAAVVIFPRGLDHDLTRGEPVSVQVVLDGTDSNRSAVAADAAVRYFAGESLRIGRARLALRAGALGRPVRSAQVLPVRRVYYNPGLVTAVFMVPGIAAMVLLMVTTIATAMGIAREREMGTLEQVMVTPISPAVLMLGKLVPFLLIGAIDFGLAIATGAYLFDMPIRGHLLFLFGATALYTLGTLGTGLLISTLAKTQQQAFMGGFLFMLPANLLSGTMTPVASMPEWLRPITYLNPLRYYIEINRAVLLKGAGFEDLWPQVAALAAFGVVIVAVAALRFRKQLA